MKTMQRTVWGRGQSFGLLVGLLFLWMRPIDASPEWPNEPPGATLITENPWNPGYFPCAGCTDAYGWVAVNGNATIVSNPKGIAPPASPPYALQFNYRTTDGTDNAPDIVGTSIPATNELYAGFWFMLNDEFRQYGGGTKLFFTMQGDGEAYTGFMIPTANAETGELVVNFYLPGTTINNCHLQGVIAAEFCTTGTVNLAGNVRPNYVLSTNTWHRMELYLKTATAVGAKNGIIRMWVDGNLAMDYTTVDTDPRPFFDVQVTPTYHGVQPNNLMYLWYDHVRVSKPSGTPDTTPPSTPAMNAPSVISSSQINLSWTASTDTGGSGLAGYHLERCQGATCTTFTEIASLAAPATSYPNTGLTPTTPYRYRVRARDNANPPNYSGYSTPQSGTTLAGCQQGDLDCSGKVDLDDLRRMIYMLIGTVPKDLLTADLDGDGAVTLADLQALVRILVGLP